MPSDSPTPALGVTPAPATTFTADFAHLFGDRSVDRCLPDALESALGPIAYAHDLYGYTLELERDYTVPPYSPLECRRPDIGQLLLDEPALKGRIPRLTLVIEILEAMVRRTTTAPPASTATDIMASAFAPAMLPFDRSWDLAMQVFRQKHQSRWTVLRQIDRDFPGFAHGNVTTAGMRETLVLCNPLSPSQVKRLIAPPTNGMDATLRESYGLAGDVSVDTLADTDTFLQATGLGRKGLRQLLAVNGVARTGHATTPTSVIASVAGKPDADIGGHLFGASFINDGSAPALRLLRDADDTRPSSRIEGLTAGHLDRIDRMLRLRAATKLPFAAIDRLLQACSGAQGSTSHRGIDVHVLRALGLFTHLHDTRRVDVDAYAAVIHQIAPYATGREKPYYDRLFGTGDGNAGLVMDGASFANGRTDATFARLCEGLGVSAGTMVKLLAWIVDERGQKTPVRDLDLVSACHRLVIVPRWLGLDETQALALLELFKVTHPGLFSQLAGVPTLDTAKGGKADATAAKTTTTEKTTSPSQAAGDVIDAMVTLMNVCEWLRQHALDATALRIVLSADEAPAPIVDAVVARVQAKTRDAGTGRIGDGELAAAFAGMPFASSLADERKTPLATLAPWLYDDGALRENVIALEDPKALRAGVEATLRKLTDMTDDTDQATAQAIIRDKVGDVGGRVAALLLAAGRKQRERVDDTLQVLLPGIDDAALRDGLRQWAGLSCERLVALYATEPDRTAIAAAAKLLHQRAALVLLLRLTAGDIAALQGRPAAFGLQKGAEDASLLNIDLVFVHRMTGWNLVVSEAARRSGRSPAEAANDLVAWLNRSAESSWTPGKLATVLGIDESRLTPGGVTPTTVPELAWLLRLLAVADASGLSADALYAFSSLGVDPPLVSANHNPRSPDHFFA